ncbi:MAG: hypothetical protein U0904_10210 [Candidatus Nanopelagicales bacterium]|nr:hypothetical protein [Candidatus Nanopelagicales bacterium]
MTDFVNDQADDWEDSGTATPARPNSQPFGARPARKMKRCPKCGSRKTIPVVYENVLFNPPSRPPRGRYGKVIVVNVTCIVRDPWYDTACGRCGCRRFRMPGGARLQYRIMGELGRFIADAIGEDSVRWTDSGMPLGLISRQIEGRNVRLDYRPGDILALEVTGRPEFVTKLRPDPEAPEPLPRTIAHPSRPISLGVHGELLLTDSDVLRRWPQLLDEVYSFWAQAVAPYQETLGFRD